MPINFSSCVSLILFSRYLKISCAKKARLSCKTVTAAFLFPSSSPINPFFFHPILSPPTTQEDVIRQALLPILTASIEQDNTFYHSLDPTDTSPPTQPLQQFHSDLVEIKFFVSTKLLDLSQICLDETNIFSIILIFEKIIAFERTSSIEQMSVPVPSAPTTLAKQPQQGTSSAVLSPPASAVSASGSGLFNPNLAYMSRIVQGLVDMFERHFCGTACWTRSCAKIFALLSGYLGTFYTAGRLGLTGS